MDLVELLFKPQGRIARLPYFLSSIAILVVFAVIIVIAFVFTAGALYAGFAAMGLIGIALFFGVVCALFYVSTVLTIKRLHDMGLIGWHAAWIMGASLVGSSLNRPHGDPSLFGLLCSLVSFGATLWLLFKPGDDFSNEYGPAPSSISI